MTVTNLLIRNAAADDLAAIVRLQRQCFARPLPVRMLRRELVGHPVAHYLVAQRAPGRVGTAGVAPASGRGASRSESSVLGYAGVRRIVDEVHLCALGVTPSMRRHGIGRGLVDAVLGWSARQGVECVSLEVRPSNAPALALYRACGFEEVGRRVGYYPDTGEDALILTVQDLSSDGTP